VLGDAGGWAGEVSVPSLRQAGEYWEAALGTGECWNIRQAEAAVSGGERVKWAWEVSIGGGIERWMWGRASIGNDNFTSRPSRQAAR